MRTHPEFRGIILDKLSDMYTEAAREAESRMKAIKAEVHDDAPRIQEMLSRCGFNTVEALSFESFVRLEVLLAVLEQYSETMKQYDACLKSLQTIIHQLRKRQKDNYLFEPYLTIIGEHVESIT